MKKNGEYVGVDEKFIPENEKYVDESLLGNKEESARKIKKTAKTIGIGYICFFFLIFAFMIGMMIFGFTSFNKSRNEMSSIFSRGNMFTFNHLQGTNYGNTISDYLDDIVTNNKSGRYTTITVVYNENSATSEDDIVAIKRLLDDWTKYECSLDYDSNGAVNKLTIKDI